MCTKVLPQCVYFISSVKMITDFFWNNFYRFPIYTYFHGKMPPLLSVLVSWNIPSSSANISSVQTSSINRTIWHIQTYTGGHVSSRTHIHFLFCTHINLIIVSVFEDAVVISYPAELLLPTSTRNRITSFPATCTSVLLVMPDAVGQGQRTRKRRWIIKR